ncbi:hypothetical protein CDO30_02385 [Sinorhizobium meliloti]|nr:hypothetical protein CDO30_02385 [Sinorhizobium meliloti]PTD25873.1 hypothetical protein C5N13_21885 [Sinorhizobium meliloti]
MEILPIETIDAPVDLRASRSRFTSEFMTALRQLDEEIAATGRDAGTLPRLRKPADVRRRIFSAAVSR